MAFFCEAQAAPLRWQALHFQSGFRCHRYSLCRGRGLRHVGSVQGGYLQLSALSVQ